MQRTIKTFKEIIIESVIAILLTAVFSYPLITKLSTFVDETGDLILCQWILNQNFHKIIHFDFLNQEKYFSSQQFYPLTKTLAFSEHMFSPSIIYTAIRLILKEPILSFNVFLYSTFVLNFISAYLVIKKIIKDKLASLIGATIYSFNTLVFAHFPGHVQLLNRYFLPPLFYFSIKLFSKPNKKHAVLFALFFMLNSLTSLYFALFSGIIIIAAATVYIKNILNVLKQILIIIPFLIVSIYFYYPYLEVSQKYNLKRTLDETVNLSSNLNSWIIPSKNSLLYGNLIFFPSPPEKTLFPGVAASFLFLYAIIFLILKKQLTSQKTLLISFFVALFALILSFGPFFKQIRLPFFYLFRYIPFFQSVRAPSRFAFIFYIPFAIFCAFGVKNIALITKKPKIVYLIFFCLIILENLFKINLPNQDKTYSLIENYSKSNQKIIEILKNKRVLHLPVKPEEREEAEAQFLTWNLFTNETMVNGYSGFRPQAINLLLEDVNSNITKQKLNTFQNLKINFIIVHKYLFQKTAPKINLPTVFEDKNIIIYEI